MATRCNHTKDDAIGVYVNGAVWPSASEPGMGSECGRPVGCVPRGRLCWVPDAILFAFDHRADSIRERHVGEQRRRPLIPALCGSTPARSQHGMA